jgi:membrane protein YqaA with SNARE-associated domain
MWELSAYFGLFLAAFGAATLLPMQSEAVLVRLLLSWVPIIGDPLTVVAGIMRAPVWSFLLLVTLAKAARYLALVALTFGWLL